MRTFKVDVTWVDEGLLTNRWEKTMNARLIGTREINEGIYRHVSITEAARLLVVSVSTLRRRARALGIRRFSGRAVAGGMVIDRSPAPICITYCR